MSCKTEQPEVNDPPDTNYVSEQIYKDYQEVIAVKMDYDQCRGWQAVRKGDKWGVVDHQGKVIHPVVYQKVMTNKSGMVLLDGKVYKFFDEEGGRIGISDALQVWPHGDLHFLAKNKKGYGLLSRKGSEILAYGYDRITGKNNTLFALRNNVWKTYNAQGMMIDSHNDLSSANLDFYTSSRVKLRGIGSIKIGDNSAQLATKVPNLKISPSEEASCMTVSPAEGGPKVAFLLEKNKRGKWLLERIYISDRGITTLSGVGIGDTEAKLKATYGERLTSSPNKYNTDALDYFYIPKDKSDQEYRLHFLVVDGEVESYSVGRMPAIQYVEMCY